MYPKYFSLVYKLSPFFNPLTAEAAWNTLTDPIRVALGDVTVPTGPFYRFLYSNPQVALYIVVSGPLFVYLYELVSQPNDGNLESEIYEDSLVDAYEGYLPIEELTLL